VLLAPEAAAVLTRLFTLDMPDAAAARIVGLIVTLPPVTFWRARVDVDRTFWSWVESVRSRRDPATPVLLLTMPTMAAYCTVERWFIRWVMDSLRSVQRRGSGRLGFCSGLQYVRSEEIGIGVNHAHTCSVILHGR
jgi:hypothetical protein